MRVAAPDLRPAPAGVAATGLQDYLAQAAEALAEQPQPCVVIGASLGGLLAAHVATLAAGLVMVNPVPPAPWHVDLPAAESGDVIPWRGNARLASTRAALGQADAASALYAFRRWRDESGAVLRDARAGVAIAQPGCPVLCIASLQDTDIPEGTTQALARAWGADMVCLPGGHVDPLLGREVADVAGRVLAWLSAR